MDYTEGSIAKVKMLTMSKPRYPQTKLNATRITIVFPAKLAKTQDISTNISIKLRPEKI